MPIDPLEVAVTSGEPSISVVIACRNEAALLPRQLAALRAQEVQGWVDTIVVDDGSTDDTHRVAEAHGRRLPGFRVVRTSPRNRAAALNAGAAGSTGEAVVFVDGDDEVAPGHLASLRAALAGSPFVAACLDHETLNPPWLRGVRPHEQIDGLRTELPLSFPVAIGATLAVRREVMAAVGGFDESLSSAEDTDFCWRLALAGVSLEPVPEAVLRYRYRPTVRGQFDQARRYGRGGIALEHRYRCPPSAVMIGGRFLRLVALVGALPTLRDRSVRAATAFQAGLLVGWLEAALRPRRYFPRAALEPVIRATDQVPTTARPPGTVARQR